MSEGSAEGGGAPLSGGQFGDVTQAGDIPPYTAQNPGTGIFAMGWGRSLNRDDDRPKSRRRKKRKKSR